MTGDLGWLTARPVAHRGLHDVAPPENSLAAARAAIRHGYAIECDVLLSRDGVPMIFHDHELARMTGASGELGERTAGDLAATRLLGSAETIPTVAAFLSLIEGAVPIVMELKGTDPERDAGFMDRLAPLLDAYRGRLALMSFDAWLIDQALAYGGRPVGLTAEGVDAPLLAAHRSIYDRGCSFTSYGVADLPNDFVTYVRRERQSPALTWTVRSPAEVASTKAHADQMTFEGFLPQN